MPVYRRYFDPGQLQFITSSTYRRVKLFDSERFRRDFVDVLRQLREQWGFLLIGWVVMPEHFHLLLQPQPAESTTRILQELKKQTGLRVISTLGANRQYPWCAKVLTWLRLPPTVHSDSHYRVWQRRFYPFNVYSPKKRLEKLNYMHGNPVRRGLVSSPEQWPWSSFRFYYLQDFSLLRAVIPDQ